MIDNIKIVHPRDMLDRTILVTGNGVTMYLPHVEGGLSVDCHPSEIIRLGENDNHIIDTEVPPSVGKADFPTVSLGMMEGVGKGVSDLLEEEVVILAVGD